jgi:HK97 family phage portal protein
VTVKFEDGARLFHVSLDGRTEIYDESEMTQVMLFSLDGLTGSSPIRLAREAIATGLAGDRAAASMFSSGLMISGLVTSDETLTEEDAKLVKAGLDAKLTGTHNAGSLAFVNRSLKISPWTMNAEDAQFIESRQHQVTEIARIFGIPKVLLAEDGASTWGSGIAELDRGMAKYTLRGYTTPFEQRASFITRGSTFVEFDYAGLLQGTPREEIELLMLQIQAGLLTVDEARGIRNLPPLGASSPPPAEPIEGGV